MAPLTSFRPGWVQIVRQLVVGANYEMTSCGQAQKNSSGSNCAIAPVACNGSSCNRALTTWRIVAANTVSTVTPTVSIQLQTVTLSGQVCGGFIENSDRKVWALDVGNPPDLRMYACTNTHSLFWNSSAPEPVIDGWSVGESPCNFCTATFQRSDFDFFHNIMTGSIMSDIIAQEFPFQCFVTGNLDWVQQVTLDISVFSFVIGLSRFVYVAALRV
jgi:hypothetical protein